MLNKTTMSGEVIIGADDPFEIYKVGNDVKVMEIGEDVFLRQDFDMRQDFDAASKVAKQIASDAGSEIEQIMTSNEMNLESPVAKTMLMNDNDSVAPLTAQEKTLVAMAKKESDDKMMTYLKYGAIGAAVYFLLLRK